MDCRDVPCFLEVGDTARHTTSTQVTLIDLLCPYSPPMGGYLVRPRPWAGPTWWGHSRTHHH